MVAIVLQVGVPSIPHKLWWVGKLTERGRRPVPNPSDRPDVEAVTRRSGEPQLPSAALICLASSSASASISSETNRFSALILAATWSAMFVAYSTIKPA